MTIYWWRKLTLFGYRYYWHGERNKNGRIMCGGLEGYVNRQDMFDAIATVRSFLPLADVVPKQ